MVPEECGLGFAASVEAVAGLAGRGLPPRAVVPGVHRAPDQRLAARGEIDVAAAVRPDPLDLLGDAARQPVAARLAPLVLPSATAWAFPSGQLWHRRCSSPRSP